MKRFLFCLLFGLFIIDGKAQTEITEKVKTYIEIWSMHKASTPTIDTGEGKGSDTYKTEDGREIVFHSSIGAVNWFISNGWKLESSHMSTCNDRTIKMYVVSKEVSIKHIKSKQDAFIKKK